MKWQYENIRDEYVCPHCERTRFIDNERSMLHLHYNIEILYVTQGKLTLELFNINNKLCNIEIHTEQYVIINSNVIHETVRSQDCQYHLAFIPPKCLNEQLLPDISRGNHTAICDNNGEVLKLLSIIADYSNIQDDSYKILLKNSLANALIALIIPKLLSSSEADQSSVDGEDVYTYVYKNYHNPELTIKCISARFGYSPKKLTDMFICKFGMGVRQYINTLRLNDIKIALLESNDSVELIARKAGFDCERTFYRIFIRYVGCTPTEYRNTKDNNI